MAIDGKCEELSRLAQSFHLYANTVSGFRLHLEPVRGPEGDLYLRGDLGVLAALRAGDTERAAEIGARRLQNAGLLPVNASYLGGFNCSRLAASLLIPVPYHAAMRRILKSREAK